MAFKDLKDLRMHERFAAHNSKERIAHRLGFVDKLVHRSDIDSLLLGSNVDPTALTTQVAAVDDGHVKKRRKELALLHAALVLKHRPRAFETHVPGKLPNQPLVSLKQKPLGHPEGVHV